MLVLLVAASVCDRNVVAGAQKERIGTPRANTIRDYTASVCSISSATLVNVRAKRARACRERVDRARGVHTPQRRDVARRRVVDRVIDHRS